MSERYSCQVPAALIRVITETLRSPQKIYSVIEATLKEPELSYSYIVKKNTLQDILHKHFDVDIESADSIGIFKLFKVNAQQFGTEHQVVNILEFLSGLVLLS